MALVRAVEWAVRHPKSFAAVYGAIEAGVAWVGYKYSKFQIDNIRKAYSYLNSPGTMPRPYGKRLGPSMGLDMGTYTSSKRRDTTNYQYPTSQYLNGAKVVVGDRPIVTKSTSKKKARTGTKRGTLKSIVNHLMKTNKYRWQSINKDNGVYTDPRSLYFNATRLQRGWVNNAGTVTFDSSTQVQSMPAFAFDLTTLPFQGPVNSLADAHSGNLLESVPFYRMYKRCWTGAGAVGDPASLNPSVRNYFWHHQNGLSNGPSMEYNGNGKGCCWSPEYMESAVGDMVSSFLNRWMSFDFFVRCSRVHNCKIHFSVVKFHNACGPRRYYKEGGVYNTDQMIYTTDDNPNASSQQAIDAFWETFWASKIVHPLCSYKTNHNRMIQFISDEVLETRPEESAENKPLCHLKSIVFSDGSWHDLHNAVADDSVLNDEPKAGARQPPVCLNPNASSFQTHYAQPHGFNVEYVTESRHIYNRTHDSVEKNLWLFVWMETDGIVPDSTAQVHHTDVSGNTTMQQNEDAYLTNACDPSSVYFGDTAFENSCAFDMRVRKCVDVVSLK